jgi:hypothetical protein
MCQIVGFKGQRAEPLRIWHESAPLGGSDMKREFAGMVLSIIMNSIHFGLAVLRSAYQKYLYMLRFNSICNAQAYQPVSRSFSEASIDVH